MPELIFTTNPKVLIGNNPLIIFDKERHPEWNEGYTWSLDSSLRSEWQKNIYGLIWPEGGLTARDYQTFEWTKYNIYGLGETILRTETAAIIWWWLLQNNI
jgi:RsmE family RNA methyltransferase